LHFISSAQSKDVFDERNGINLLMILDIFVKSSPKNGPNQRH